VKAILEAVVGALLAAPRPRAILFAENLVLRQQLAILRRATPRPRLRPIDRAFWVIVSRLWSRWAECLAIVQPATVIGWHRRGFARWWAWKSRPVGRPPLAPELVSLIEQMALENPLWSRRRIASELAKLGYAVDKDTVAKYMPRPAQRPRNPPSQTWKTFLRNHLAGTIAIDFLTVPTVTFNVLYVFFVLSLERRRVLHVNVTVAPLRYVGRAADCGGHRRGDRAGATDSRSRCHLRHRVRCAGEQSGLPADPDLAALSVAKRVRGKMGGHPTSRAARSRHRAWRAPSAASGPPACGLLQQRSASHVAWRGLAGLARRRAADCRQSCCASTRRWTAPPVLKGRLIATRFSPRQARGSVRVHAAALRGAVIEP
jgi:hypothetical protein